ncbi:hypothetical protein NITLEN_20717 [Nitrospira lenta]|uniref:Uncharacterized protein n=1 Tax=Nitrospira lenta TaxID=1436998 RepID=A0A330L5V1_9BACT|nr:hypothetical protein NITLEN_20717 [Nitrospira lenta]
MSGVVVGRGFYLADTFVAPQCSKGRAWLTRCSVARAKIKLVRQGIVHEAANLIGPKGFLQNMSSSKELGHAQKVLLT